MKRRTEVNHRRRRPTSAALVGTAFAALVAALWIGSAATALAAVTHPYTGTSFGPDGVAGNEAFASVQGVAVDQRNGDVLVLDAGAGKVYKFTSAGVPVDFAATGSNSIEGVGGGGGGESEIALAPAGAVGGTEGDIYVANNSVVKIYAASGAELGQLEGGETCGVATDPAGDVLVGSFPSSVVEYVPTANPPIAADEHAAARARLSEICNVATDGSGDVYAANYEGRSIAALEGLTDTSPRLIEPGGATLGVDPSSEDLYVDRSGSIAQYDAGGSLLGGFGSSQLSGSHGVAIEEGSGEVFADSGGGKIDIFGAGVVVPTAIIAPATGVAAFSGTLNAEIDPEGLAVSKCVFEYGPETSYGTTTPCEGSIPTDENNHPVTAALAGLSASTAYHFRVVVTNANGSSASEDETLTTASPAVTAPASAISSRKATLNGVVFPEGEAVSECLFEYGTSESFGKVAACEQSIPSDRGEHKVTADLTGLTANATTYYFRLVVNLSGPVFNGVTQTFATEPQVVTGEATATAPPQRAVLHGAVSPAGSLFTACEFEYGTTEALGTSVPCAQSPAEIGSGEGPVPVSAEIKGLSSTQLYYYRLTATNAGETVVGKIKYLFTPGPVVIEDSFTTAVGETEATLGAKVRPAGLPTRYYFEYGPTQAYGSTTEQMLLGESFGGLAFRETLTGLSPDTTYHWRLIASNPLSAQVVSPDHTFRTRLAAEAEPGCPNQALRVGPSAALPDCRAYELVSPAIKHGEVYGPSQFGGNDAGSSTGMPMETAGDGDSIVYEGQPFFESNPGGPNEYLARRTASGWSTESLSAVNSSEGEQQGFKSFSPSFSQSVVYQQTPALSANAPTAVGESYANLYLRADNGEFRPLITEAPPHRTSGESEAARFDVVFGGANSGTDRVPAFRVFAFEANDSLTSAVPGIAPAAPAIEESPEPQFQNNCTLPALFEGEHSSACDLYEWVDGHLSLINVLPGNISAVPGYLGSGCRGCLNGTYNFGPNFENAISADGSRIFWSEEDGQVYVRVNGTETKKFANSGSYLQANQAGSKVLLDDGCLYEIEAETCADLTEDHTGAHRGGFQGIMGGSADLSLIYYVDTAALTPEASENANGEHAVEGRDNLYMWSEGVVSFIGIMNQADEGSWAHLANSRRAQMTPSGQFLAFQSTASLTGFENHGYSEIFEYDAESKQLTCVSCNPTNARPVGGAEMETIRHNYRESLPRPANLPENGGGRIFFESRDVLTTEDKNGSVQDVYEWEPDSIGGCREAEGCISLISSGQDEDKSVFLDATPSGDNAFFVTRARLVSADGDDRADIFDARVDGGFPEETAVPCASGSACRGPSAGPTAPLTAGSSTFNGPGNPKPSHRRPHRKRKHHKRRRKNHPNHHKKNHHKKSAHQKITTKGKGRRS